MRSKHKRQLDTLNHETEAILSDFERLDNSLLQQKGKGWSIIQVLSHLEISEAGTLQYMQKKMQAGKSMKRTNGLQKLKMRITNLFQYSSMRWKAPSYLSDPPQDYTFHEIKDKWMNTRAAVVEYVERYPEDLMNRLVFKHPFAGRQALTEAISSIIYHQRHHKHQLNRIRKELNI